MNKNEELEKIKYDVLNLTSSPLYQDRVKNKYFPVIGQGNHDAEIMFIGEAPGKNEAQQGRPFCGSAGKILDELLDSVGIKREKVYITNIVKDRPPQNRDPLPEEIEAYGPFLDRQIEIIQPKIIVTLGRYSMYYIMQKMGLEKEIQPIGKMHGNVFENGKFGNLIIKIIPLYHPAATIYNQSLKMVLLEDFKKINNIYKILSFSVLLFHYLVAL